MDVVRFKGGLGNQMFQYAFYRSLECRGREVKASLGFYKKNPEKTQFCITDVFSQAMLKYISEEKFEVINSAWKEIKQDNDALERFLKDYKNRFFWVEDTEHVYQPKVFETQNCTFVGYWQSEKYFNNIRDILLKDFEFSYGEKKLNDLRKEFLSSKQYISIHIRRGDYLNYVALLGNLGESKYYKRAIQVVENENPNCQLVFFSNDIQWVKKEYKYKNAIYIEEDMFDNYESWYDMCLMSCCSYNIIANSSFSWWGAWLNQRPERKVIAPQPWFNGYEMPDICPEDWIRLSG